MVDNAHQHREHLQVSVLAHNLSLLSIELSHHISLVVTDAGNIDGLDTHAAIGERRVGGNHLAHGDFADAQAERWYLFEVAGDAERVHPLGKF